MQPKRSLGRGCGCFLLVCAALVGLASVGAWMLRNVVLTEVLDDELRARGVTCDALSIQSSALLGEITVAPTSCALSAQAVSRIRWSEPLTLTRTGMQITRVSTPHVEVMRVAPLGSLPSLLEGPEQVGALLLVASQLSRSPATPAVEVGQLEVRAEGGTLAELTLTELRVAERVEGPLSAQVQSITFPAVAGPMGTSIQPSLAEVTLHAEPTTGQLAGELDAGARLPILGTLAMRRHIEVIGTELDQPSPRWSLR